MFTWNGDKDSSEKRLAMGLKPVLHVSNSGKSSAEVIVVSEEAFSYEMLADFSAVVLNAGKTTYRQVEKIKGDHRDSVYLKPLFIWTERPLLDEYILELIDGQIVGEPIIEYVTRFHGLIAKINDTIDNLVPFHGIKENDEYEIELKVIRHLYTRNKELKPIRSADTLHGYTYPVLQAFLASVTYQEFILVDFLKHRELVTGTFEDKIHHCPHCYCAYLNFREICYKCGSADLYVEDLIHHFRCAYEGPESDFFTENGLVCPKCHKVLKQIGVDFDRPSEIYTCNSCKQVFQDPDVDVKCINCGEDTVIDNVLERRIERYALTALGKTSAQNGIMFTLKDELKDTLEIVDYSVFKKVVDVERARIGRYKKSESSVIRISFNNYIELAAREGENLEHLNQDIGDAIKQLTRTSDLISFRNNTELLLLFTETTEEWSRHALNRIVETLQSLVENSTQMQLKMTTNVQQIRGDISIDELLRSLEKND